MLKGKRKWQFDSNTIQRHGCEGKEIEKAKFKRKKKKKGKKWERKKGKKSTPYVRTTMIREEKWRKRKADSL